MLRGFQLLLVLLLATPWSASALALLPGDLIVADTQSGVVRVDPSSGEQTLVAAFGDPTDFLTEVQTTAVAADGSGRLWVATYTSPSPYDADPFAQLWRVDPVTGNRSVVWTSPFARFSALALGAGGVFVANSNSPAGIHFFDSASGTASAVSTRGLFVSPVGLAFDANVLYVADRWAFGSFPAQGGVIAIDPVTGQQTPIFVVGTAEGSLSYPDGIAMGSDGVLRVAFGATVAPGGKGRGGVASITLAGVLTELAQGGVLIIPSTLAIGADGAIYVVQGSRIHRLHSDGTLSLTSSGDLLKGAGSLSVVPTPEPGSGLLVVLGLGALAVGRRRLD